MKFFAVCSNIIHQIAMQLNIRSVFEKNKTIWSICLAQHTKTYKFLLGNEEIFESEKAEVMKDN